MLLIERNTQTCHAVRDAHAGMPDVQDPDHWVPRFAVSHEEIVFYLECVRKLVWRRLLADNKTWPPAFVLHARLQELPCFLSRSRLLGVQCESAHKVGIVEPLQHHVQVGSLVEVAQHEAVGVEHGCLSLGVGVFCGQEWRFT